MQSLAEMIVQFITLRVTYMGDNAASRDMYGIVWLCAPGGQYDRRSSRARQLYRKTHDAAKRSVSLCITPSFCQTTTLIT
jgi:hypothetical protein